MIGMIFAAGLGTRLRPLTDTTPKALIEVGGEPMLSRVIRRMRAAGIDEIVVNVHHHARMVKEFLAGSGVEISDESDMLLDTGGALVKAFPMLAGRGDVLIHNADVWTDLPLESMIEAHSKSGADATLLTRNNPSARALMWNDQGRLAGWANLSTGEVRPPGLDTSSLTPLGFGGIHILNEQALNRLVGYAPAQKFSITPFYADCCGNLDIEAFPVGEYRWIDIGKPESLAEARRQAQT